MAWIRAEAVALTVLVALIVVDNGRVQPVVATPFEMEVGCGSAGWLVVREGGYAVEAVAGASADASGCRADVLGEDRCGVVE